VNTLGKFAFIEQLKNGQNMKYQAKAKSRVGPGGALLPNKNLGKLDRSPPIGGTRYY
jgi:hypothetical protein